jgi:hypothetical protein
MKRIFLTVLAMSIIATLQAQEDAATHMYETIYLSPKLESVGKLNESLAAHNKKYHGEGIHFAWVNTVVTGRRTGDLVWGMGPGPFSSLDTRPAEGGHDEDWATTVLPYLKDISQSEYWRRDSKAWYAPENYSVDKIRIRFYKVKRGQTDAFVEHYSKLVEVFRAKKYNRQLSLYYNTFPTAYGRNMASVSSFDNWADLDKGLPVGQDFNATHGEGSWAKWQAKFSELTEWTDQEVRQNLPELSGTADN